MALETIIKSTDWSAIVNVAPAANETIESVKAALTGATVAFDLREGGAVVVTGTGVIWSVSARQIKISLTDTQTAALNVGDHDLDVRITTTGAMIYPIRINNRTVRVEAY